LGAQKINLHAVGAEWAPHALHPTAGAGDLCLITRTPLELVGAERRAAGVQVIEGPVVRTGSRGPIHSLYFYDPDGNLIEVSNYDRRDGVSPRARSMAAMRARRSSLAKASPLSPRATSSPVSTARHAAKAWRRIAAWG
jgi:hypothetical protein